MSYRVNYKSARGVVGGVDSAQCNHRAPVMSRYTIIILTLRRAARMSVQDTFH